MKVNLWEEARWLEHITEAFTTNVIVWPFSWSAQGVISMDVKVNSIPAKAAYDPGCDGVAVLRYFVEKSK